MQTTAYAHRVELDIPYEDAIERAIAALKEEGFGVLTRIDMKAALKDKIGVDIDRYMILGACNPPLAHRALQAEREIGILLPCNVIVYETGPGQSVVAAMAPKAAMSVVGGNTELDDVADEADDRLQRAMAAVKGESQ